MCGICGAVGFDSKETGEAIVRRMLAAIIHRGPDQEGILVIEDFVATLAGSVMRGLRLNGDAYAQYARRYRCPTNSRRSNILVHRRLACEEWF
jgi:asparagine synthetase B (glutamine-hydrolysing)